ncbi:hypothetical protein Pfo_009459 [Paulownia fortunei]|nr:hypothetical protein Pfo_009459 [Paulownia fortunei]
MALKIKGVEYEFIEINPFQKTLILHEANHDVHKKIPVLVHGERPICETLIIVQYIDDAWTNAPSILPSDPFDRAIARFWPAYWFPLFQQLRETQEEEARKTLVQKISQKLVLLEEPFINCTKGKAFFNGDNVGYLEIALGSHAGWLRVTEILVGVKLLDENKTPRMVEWLERLHSDSPVNDVMLETQTIILEVFKKF